MDTGRHESCTSLAKVTEAYGKKPELLAAMNRFAQQRAEFESQPHREGSATYRRELSGGAEWTMGQERFWVIAVTRGARAAMERSSRVRTACGSL